MVVRVFIEDAAMRQAIAVMILLFVTGSGLAQETSSGRSVYDLIKPEDLKNYCIYQNNIYSIGAFTCEGKQANTCAGPNDTPPPGMNPVGRAFWRTAKADQVCGAN
jgi:hypothetical protein